MYFLPTLTFAEFCLKSTRKSQLGVFWTLLFVYEQLKFAFS